MGMFDTAEDKEEALAKKEAKLKAQRDEIAKREKEHRNVLAYEMGAEIKRDDVFTKWIKNHTASPITKFAVAMIVGAFILGLGLYAGHLWL